MNVPCVCVALYRTHRWAGLAGRHVVVEDANCYLFDRGRSLSDVAEPAILKAARKLCSGPLEMLSAHFCAQAIPAGSSQPGQQ